MYATLFKLTVLNDVGVRKIDGYISLLEDG